MAQICGYRSPRQRWDNFCIGFQERTAPYLCLDPHAAGTATHFIDAQDVDICILRASRARQRRLVLVLLCCIELGLRVCTCH